MIGQAAVALQRGHWSYPYWVKPGELPTRAAALTNLTPPPDTKFRQLAPLPSRAEAPSDLDSGKLAQNLKQASGPFQSQRICTVQTTPRQSVRPGPKKLPQSDVEAWVIFLDTKNPTR